jgi:alkylated DNA nucleotide flippase Atl1
MAANPLPLLIPCHRVVSHLRTPGNYGGGGELKIALLLREGIEFDRQGRIEKRFFYLPELGTTHG